MKIVLISRHLPPRIDAVGDYTYRLAHTLAQVNVQTVLVTSKGFVTTAEDLRVDIKPIVQNWGCFGVWNLANTLRTWEIDAVNFQFVPHMYSRFGINLAIAMCPFLLRIRLKKPVMTTCHELLSHKPVGVSGWLLQSAYLLQAWLILLGSSRLTVPAAWQERLLRRYFPCLSQKIVRIPVGANILPKNFSPNTQKGIVTLGTFGSGHPWWQYEMAMAILKGLRILKIPARLLCIGNVEGSNPEYYQRLRQREIALGLSGFIEWTGYCSVEEVSRRLRAVDIFLALQKSGITSRSTALMAAMAHGLPIVATRGPDADEELLESGSLCIIDPLDLSEAVETVAQLALNSVEQKELGRRAELFYQERFSWEKIRDLFLDAVKSTQ